MWVGPLGQEDPLDKEMAIQSRSCLGNLMDWRAHRELYGLQSTEPQRVRHNQVREHAHTHSVSLGSALQIWTLIFVCTGKLAIENEENNYSNEKMYGKPLEQCLVGSEWSMYDG